MPTWVRKVTRLSVLWSLICLQDINRELALKKLKLPALLRRLTEEDKADIALGVLYNLCLDYGILPHSPSTLVGLTNLRAGAGASEG